MAGVEDFVRVADDGSGKKIRNAQLQIVKTDGSEHTVHAQVVLIADPEGHLVDAGTTRLLEAMQELLQEVREMKEVLVDLTANDLKQANVRESGRYYSFLSRKGT